MGTIGSPHKTQFGGRHAAIADVKTVLRCLIRRPPSVRKIAAKIATVLMYQYIIEAQSSSAGDARLSRLGRALLIAILNVQILLNASLELASRQFKRDVLVQIFDLVDDRPFELC